MLKSDDENESSSDEHHNEQNGHNGNENSEMKAILNNSVTFLNEINAATSSNYDSQKTRNLTDILKRFVGGSSNVGGSTNGSEGGENSHSGSSSPSMSRRASVPTSNFDQLARPLKHVDLFADSKNVQVAL